VHAQGKVGRVISEQDEVTGELRFSYLVKSEQLTQRMLAPPDSNSLPHALCEPDIEHRF
jgi:hypothetical protein